MVRRFRPVAHIPWPVLLGFAVIFATQVAVKILDTDGEQFSFKPLPAPHSEVFYRAAFLGSSHLASDLLLINLQLHDTQGGRFHDYSKLDYETLSDWIMLSNSLNPQSHYPGFLMSRVYGGVNDKQKLAQVVSVIDGLFDQNPMVNWRRMTEAVLIAKHRIGDLELALKLSQKISDLDPSYDLPRWARDMHLVVLDQMGEKEAAMTLIASILQTDETLGNDERRFLEDRLSKIQQELLAK